MVITESFMFWLKDNPFIFALAVSFLLGEEGVFFSAFIGGQGYMPLWMIYIAGVIGSSLGDVFWILISLSPLHSWLRKKITKKEDKREVEFLRKTTGNRKLISLMALSKFLNGTRLITIFYASRRAKNVKHLILVNTTAVAIWGIFLVPFAWFIGKWAYVSLDIFKEINYVLGFAFAFVIAMVLIDKFVIPKLIKRFFNRKKYLKEQKRIKAINV